MRKKTLWVKPEIRAAFEQKILETLARCQPHHTTEILPVPTLVFRNMGGRGGTNLFNPIRRNSVITINPAYFEKHYEEMLNKTLPHEVAHHVCDFIYGAGKHNKAHGWQWARVMRWIGLPPERCHRMEVEGIVKRHERPYSYSCGCGSPHLLTATLHLRIQRDNQKRFCKRCKSRIVYAGLMVDGHFTPVAKPVLNEIRTVRLGPRAIGVSFEPPPALPPIDMIREANGPNPVPESKFRVTTRMVDGVLQNVRIPLDN